MGQGERGQLHSQLCSIISTAQRQVGSFRGILGAGAGAQGLLPRAEMTADPSPTTRWFIFRTRASFHKRHKVFLPVVLWENNMKLRFTENTEGDFMASPWAFVSCGLD